MADSLQALTYLFRAHNKSRPVLLLGAGASFRSGVPLAAEAVNLIARAAFARDVRGLDYRLCHLTLSDWLPYLRKQSWFISEKEGFAENFPLAVQHLLNPREFRRQVFTDMLQAPNGVNVGYRHLARLVMRRLCWTVLTTNFDHLLVDALHDQRLHIPDISEINRSLGDHVRFNINARCQVVYLHGAVEYYRDRNLLEETQRLDTSLVALLRPLLNSSPLIVIGYRGAEASVMNHLLEEGIAESGNYRNGIFWCVRSLDDIHPNVSRLQNLIGKSNFRIVQILGFDELMADLDRELESEAFYSNADTPPSIAGTVTTYDREPLGSLSLTDLDAELIMVTLSEYCERLGLPALKGFTDAIALMREQGLLTVTSMATVPTRAAYLLFGKDVGHYFPYARVSVTRQGKRRIVFDGNLVTQYRGLIEALSSEDINPLLRVKGERTAGEQPAYPQRALVELVVNLLVHRDYSNQAYSYVDFTPGEALRFENPGGLLPRVLGRLSVGEDGQFEPVRHLTELRNPLLADIFYGLGPMDKEGTGLADVKDLMREHGGSSLFAVGGDNTCLTVMLRQPRQAAPETSRIARRVVPTEVYVTNLMPFRVLPHTLFSIPLFDGVPALSFGTLPPEKLHALPVIIEHGGKILTFADPAHFSGLAELGGNITKAEARATRDVVLDADACRRVVWLIGKHWEFYLHRFRSKGLYVETSAKRAYFQLISGERNTVVYDGRMRRGIAHDVVKPRGGSAQWHENEGFAYSVMHFGGNWAMQLKPFYMFTDRDGRTPLPSFLRTQRATRRMKFDRNKNVEDDLTFWARLLSAGHPTIAIGGTGVTDLILDSDYITTEVSVENAAGSEESVP